MTRRSIRTWGNWMVLMALLACMGGCKRPSASHSKGPVDLWTMVQHLPDSLRVNPFGDRHGIQWTAQETAQLLAEGALSQGEGMQWRLVYQDSAHHHLQLQRLGMDDGLQYDFLRLPSTPGGPFVLVIQSLSDHCCHHSRWALYSLKNGKLQDQTKRCLPGLDWFDFFTEADLAGLPAESPKANHYPFLMNITPEPPQISIELVADFVELSLPENVAQAMFAHWPAAPKVLEWRAGAFRWRE